jgi:hypothetical protein
MANYDNPMRSTYVPGMDDYYAPVLSPEVVSPEPQRYATGSAVGGLTGPVHQGHPNILFAVR